MKGIHLCRNQSINKIQNQLSLALTNTFWANIHLSEQDKSQDNNLKKEEEETEDKKSVFVISLSLLTWLISKSFSDSSSSNLGCSRTTTHSYCQVQSSVFFFFYFISSRYLGTLTDINSKCSLRKKKKISLKT